MNGVENMSEITKQEYGQLFKKKEIRQRALEQALETRKFEIELYWKRATYFWGFIAATLAGYFIVLVANFNGMDDEKTVVLFFINCLGFVFTLCWFLVNKGSKYWQENWENHVALLENTEIGPLYKILIEKEKKGYIARATRYSVSRINLYLSFFLLVMWFLLGVNTLFNFFIQNLMGYLIYQVIALVTLLAIVIFFSGYLIFYGKSKTGGEDSKTKTDGIKLKLIGPTFDEVNNEINNRENTNGQEET